MLETTEPPTHEVVPGFTREQLASPWRATVRPDHLSETSRWLSACAGAYWAARLGSRATPSFPASRSHATACWRRRLAATPRGGFAATRASEGVRVLTYEGCSPTRGRRDLHTVAQLVAPRMGHEGRRGGQAGAVRKAARARRGGSPGDRRRVLASQRPAATSRWRSGDGGASIRASASTWPMRAYSNFLAARWLSSVARSRPTTADSTR